MPKLIIKAGDPKKIITSIQVEATFEFDMDKTNGTKRLEKQRDLEAELKEVVEKYFPGGSTVKLHYKS